MAVPAEPATKLRFGEFEIDLHSAEVQRNGNKFILQGQPFQVLAILLERPGELVTREELKKRLWSANTFVDFDHSLNKAVNRLRDALQDSAEQPRYVQTIARRGYRLIVPVERPQSASTPVIPAALEAVATLPATAVERPASINGRTTWLIRKHIIGILLGLLIVSSAVLIARWRERRLGKYSISAIRSLAVLPLENLSGYPSQDYFADGMTDAMITDLGKIGSLRVISRTSAMQYKGIRKPLSQIARELNVDAVVEGTVLRSGDQVRITAQLIDARADKHLWAQSYDGDLRNMLSLQSQVADSIAGQIRARLTREEPAPAKSKQSLNPQAQDAYLRGHHFAAKGTIQDLQKALPFFTEAHRKRFCAGCFLCRTCIGLRRLGSHDVPEPSAILPARQSSSVKGFGVG